MVLRPPQVLKTGTRRWFEGCGKQTRAWEKNTKMLLIDHLLMLLETMARLGTVAILAHAESAFVLLALLVPSVRTLAYRERRVPEATT